jgi:bifunctional non-homologous end joining protein LigD
VLFRPPKAWAGAATRERRSAHNVAFNGRDLRLQLLVTRQACLQTLLERFGCPAALCLNLFEDGLALLRVVEERGLEGVVSKRRDAPYRSGECRDWRNVKTQAWREANRERWRHCEKAR